MKVALLTLVIILSTTTLYLSIPRLFSSLTYLPVEAALKHHWIDYPIKADQYTGLIETAKQSIEKLNEARYWQGLGWLYYLQATSQGTNTPEGQQSLSNAQNAFENFLKKSPASPAEWLRLSWVHSLQNHGAVQIVETLKMSLYTGRAERYLMQNRLELALQYADYFSEEDTSLISDQIQLTWRFFKRDMKKHIKSGTYNINTMNKLLTNNPELKQQINKEYPDGHDY